MSEKNYSYIDIIRAFSIIMVIALHCICDYYADTANTGRALWYATGYFSELARVGVPLFFMVSGFLLLDRDITDIKSFYKKRILKVGIPFIAYDIFYYVYMCISSGKDISASGFFSELLISGSEYHLWFVYSILFIYLLMPFLQMIVKHCDFKKLIVFFVLAIFQTSIRPFINTLLDGKLYIYLTDDGITGYIGYVILGYILGKYDFSKSARKVIYAISAAFLVLTPLVTMNSAMKTGEYLFIGGYSLNHYIEATGIFILFKTHIRKSNRFVSKMAKYSFSAYLIHVFILKRLQQIPMDFTPSVTMLIWLSATVIFSFAWGICEKIITDAIKKIFRKKVIQ